MSLNGNLFKFAIEDNLTESLEIKGQVNSFQNIPASMVLKKEIEAGRWCTDFQSLGPRYLMKWSASSS